MSTPRVLIADSMSPRAAEILSARGLDVDVDTGLSPEALAERIHDYDAILVRSATKLTAELIAKATRLKMLGRAGIGVDNIDVRAATAHGVVVENTPFGNATTTAEHAVSMMMALSRNIPQATAAMRAGRWDKKKYQGRQITGKTAGVIGLGNIGKLVAERLLGLKMQVIAYDPFISAEAAHKLGVEKVDLDELYARADYITLHVPLNDHTRHLINAEAFAAMKDGVFLVHCARGGIVSESALADALEMGKLGGAALDVFETEPPAADHPLRSHPKVILTPHLGASTFEAQEAVAVQIAEQCADLLLEGTVRNALNTASISGDVLKVLGPWLELGANIGDLAGQLHSGEVERIEVRYYGDVVDKDLTPITGRVLTQILRRRVEEAVNLVSAPVVAEARGISIEAGPAGDHPDFTNMIEVRIHGGGLNTDVKGVVFGRKHARVVALDGYQLEMIPDHHLLLIKNVDRPGVIGAVGMALGAREINVSRLVLGLKGPGGVALAVWSTDHAIDAEALAAVRAIDGVVEARHIEL